MKYIEINDIDTAREILRSSSFGAINLKEYLKKLQSVSGIDFSELIFTCDESLVFESGKSHLTSKRLISSFFSKKGVKNWQPKIKKELNSIFENIPKNKEIDLLSYYADPLYLFCIKDIIGVDFKNNSHLLSLINIAKNFTEPMQSLQKTQKTQLAISSINKLVEDSLNTPEKKTNSLIELLSKHIEIPLKKRVVLITSIIIAAHTMSETLIIIIYQLLKTENTLWQKVKDNRWLEERIDAYIRLYPTTQHIGRLVIKKANINNQIFEVGTIIQVKVSKVNRDYRFTSEEEILKGASEAKCPIKHVSFGGGNHICPGAELSRILLLEAISLLASKSNIKFSREDSLSWVETFMIKKPVQMLCRLEYHKNNIKHNNVFS